MFDLGTDFLNDLLIEGKQLDLSNSDLDFLILNLFPDTTIQLLEKFELLYDCYVPNGLTQAQRRQNLIAKMRAGGGLNKIYFYNIAAALGYNIESGVDPHLSIVDGNCPLFRADVSMADDPLYDNESGIGAFIWTVRGSFVSTDYRLRYIFEELKPAGTQVSFEDE